jgi:hypothetical protein
MTLGLLKGENMLDWFRNVRYATLFELVGKAIVAAILVTLAVVIVTSVCAGILAFASTGIGAVILCFIGWHLWKNYKEKANDK